MQTLSLAPDAADKASWDSHPGLSACISERSLGRAPHEEGGGRGGDSWGWAGGGLGEGILAHSRIGALWGGGSPEAGAEYPPRCPAAGNRNSNEPCLWRRGKDPARKAIEELLKEAKRGKTRAETMGPMGWACFFGEEEHSHLFLKGPGLNQSQKQPLTSSTLCV
ncbi:uncharacterized protein POLR1D isoform X3 [Notamacropus eugenii]|uniref:uncharacterized protein POLR1D isoform X3 n=1 Tax=Notamacropus eugenii TaxID=9315 RepID=UPI003B66CEEC